MVHDRKKYEEISEMKYTKYIVNFDNFSIDIHLFNSFYLISLIFFIKEKKNFFPLKKIMKRC